MSVKITEEQKEKAIGAYTVSGNMSEAAKVALTTRRTLEREMSRCKAFSEDMKDAKAIYTDKLEKILDDRIADPAKDKASAILLMFKMKAEMPDKYRERIDHKVDSEVRIISGVPRPKQD